MGDNTDINGSKLNSDDINPAFEGVKELGDFAVKRVVQTAIMSIGTYVLLASLIIILTVTIFYMLMEPAMAVKNAATKVYETVFGGGSSGGESGETPPASITNNWGNPFDSSVSVTISSAMGPRSAPIEGASTWHKGIDIPVPEGTPLYASADGTVTKSGNSGNGGLRVEITTADGYAFIYMHMSEIAVSVGTTLTKGQYIGKSGNTGNSSGAHLHYQINAPNGIGTKAPDGTWLLDPSSYVTGGGGGTPSTPVTPSENDDTDEKLSDSPNTGRTKDDIEKYFYNPTNVKTSLDKIYEAMGEANNGMAYITKNNFETILDKVAKYQECIRNVTNVYTYYHHLYKKEVTYAYEVEKSDYTDTLPVLGAKDDKSWEREYVEGESVRNGKTYVQISKYKVTDIENTDETGHVINKSPEDNPVFKVSWEEIYTTAALFSVTEDAEKRNWKTETKFQKHDDKNKINATGRLDENTINSIIGAFEFTIGYYFDPTSPEKMPNGDTYKDHAYTYEEMENYAYIKSKVGENVEHGTEVFPDTDNFDYYEYKKPAIAPAIATNAYTTIEYDYQDNPDGTSTLKGRQIIVDGQKFYDYMKSLLGNDFDFDWYIETLCLLPGSNYDEGNGSLSTRFKQIYESYKKGEPIMTYDTNFWGVGQVTLGMTLDRTKLQFTTAVDSEGNPIIGTTPTPGGGGSIPVNLNISVDDISDEQIRQDIANGLYTFEDLVYTAACLMAESNGTVDGMVAVAWCLRNRVESGNYSSYKAAVSAPGQFASPWPSKINNPSTQALSVAAGVIKGQIANPIGNCYYFFGGFAVWGYKPGAYTINIGGNQFYVNWGDVTCIKNRSGYTPF